MADRVTRLLRHRGVDVTTAEDLAQETALRALRTDVSFADADDLFRWAAVVAWRLAIDTRRKERRIDPEPVPDRPGPVNVSAVVEQRCALEAVGRGLRAMSESDRSAILASLGPERVVVDLRQSARLAVRRHRARARLMAALQGLLGFLGWLMQRRRSGVASRTSLTAAVAVPLLGLSLVVAPHLRVPPAGPQDQRPLAPPPLTGPSPASRSGGEGGPGDTAPTGPAEVVAGATAGGTTGAGTGSLVVPLPPMEAEVVSPDGERVTAGGRPRDEDDHTACVDAPGLHRCADAPVPLPLPSPPTPPL